MLQGAAKRKNTKKWLLQKITAESEGKGLRTFLWLLWDSPRTGFLMPVSS